MAVKVDYAIHQVKYTELKIKTPDLTVQQYCDNVGLKYETARRYIKSRVVKAKVVKSGYRSGKGRKKDRTISEWKTLYSQFIAACLVEPELTVARFADGIGDIPRTVINGFAKVKDLPQFIALSEAVDAARAAVKTPKRPSRDNVSKPLHTLAGKNKRALSLLTEAEKEAGMGGRNNRGQFTKGHRHTLTHGGYSDACKLDPKFVAIAKEIELTSLANELVAARAQYMTMLNYLGRGTEIIQARYDDDDPICDSEGNAVPMESEIMKLLFGTSDKLRNLEASMANMVTTAARVQKELTLVDLKEREAKALTEADILSIQSDILDERQLNDWSAVDTVKEMEKNGVPIPNFLLFEAKKEIADYVPPVEDGGVTDEELETLSRDYIQKQREVEGDWLPARREEVRAVFDAMDRHDAGIVDDDQATSNDDDIKLMNDAFADISTFSRLDDEISSDDDDYQQDDDQ